MKTYNPIKKSEEFQNGFFVKIPEIAEGRAIVLSVRGASDKAEVVSREACPTAKRIRSEKYNWQTEIDTALHAVDVEMQVNSANHINAFQISMTFQVKVIDPVRVCRKGIQDVAAYICGCIEGRIMEEAGGYHIDAVQELHKWLKDSFHSPLQMRDEGFEIELNSVHIDIDEESKAHLRKLHQLKEEEVYMKLKAESANRMGESLGEGTGVLMSILDGTRSPEELEEYIRNQKSSQLNSNIDSARKIMELAEDLMLKGLYSESEGKEMIKKVLGNSDILKLGGDSGRKEERIEEKIQNEYASFDD